MIQMGKTKSKKSGSLMRSTAVLGIVLMCSVTSANATWANGYNTITEKNVQTTSEKKDLSELSSRLQSRFGEVWQEVLTLIDGGVSQGGILSTSQEKEIIEDVVVEESHSLFFSDIDEDDDRYFIETLASHKIIKGSNGKFNSDSYMSVGDFIKMLVDTYRVKVGYDLNTDAGLSTKNAFDDGVLAQGWEKEINSAYELGFLTNVFDAESTQKSELTVPVTTRMIDQFMGNIEDQFPGMIQDLDLRLSDLYVKRGAAARYVVQGFDLDTNDSDFDHFDSQQESYYSDINGHKYAKDIKVLAQLGIINTNNQKFYPNNHLRNYECIVMLVNAFLHTQDEQLNVDYRANRTSQLVDVKTDAGYLPWINYAENRGITDYLTVNKRGQNFLNPDSTISKHEIYYILGELTDLDMNYDQEKADQQLMTRGEFTSLLVDALDLKVQEKKSEEIHESATQTEQSESMLDTLIKLRSLLSNLEK